MRYAETPQLCTDCREKEGLGHACGSSSCSYQHSAWHCTLLLFVLMVLSAVANVAIPGTAVTDRITDIQSAGDHMPANVVALG